jgi:hypothetical protein
MLKVLRIIIISFPVLWTNCLCQSISHQVLVPGAGLATNGTFTISQSIGEVMVKIFPNPATEFVTIEMGGKTGGIFRFEFLDLTGRIFISVKRSFRDDYQYHEQYNVKEMVSGLYIIRIMSEDGMFNRAFRIQKI